jgi:GntR family transcriptional regulator
MPADMPGSPAASARPPDTRPVEPLRSDGVPFHYQVKQQVRELIENGSWQPGTQIPSELELGQRFGVSRPTIRQALQALVNDGLLVRQRGKGTYVCYPKLEQPLTSVYSLTQLLTSKGITPQTRILELNAVAAEGRAATQLQVAPGTPLWKLRRLRLANDVPILLDTTWLPAAIWPAFNPDLLQSHSLYEVLARWYGRRAVRAQEALEPIVTDDYESGVLECKTGQAAFLVERTTYDQTGVPVEFTKTVSRGDRMRLTINLGESGLNLTR